MEQELEELEIIRKQLTEEFKFEAIHSITRLHIKKRAEVLFKERNISFDEIKCDEENNPPNIVDDQLVIINSYRELPDKSIKEFTLIIGR